ncbi:glycosyltransferase family 4 protein [Corynebacterium glutamicum]|uniref:glycosyltransferase family 4 protein n=1 Tax=Corynebacterium glutamicum TaxID=1718 RepID=UPI0004F7D405|nr:glycosyltransferase family 4 protein [Corynebacterium glutamicum]AIK86876.1 hypothetical protein AR0_02300 [Corynebacterium glutamicum]
MDKKKEWGQWLGATDAIDQKTSLEKSLELLSIAHDEITRMQEKLDKYEKATATYSQLVSAAAETTRKVTKIERLKTLRRRLISGEVKKSEGFRKLLWILVKAPAEISTFKTIPDIRTLVGKPFTSSLAGDRVVRNALNKGLYEDAYIWGRALFPRHGKNKNFVALLEQSAVKRGNISQSIALANQKLKNGWIKANSLRVAQGRLIDLEEFPTLGDHQVQTHDRNLGVVVHLAKESVPYRSNGFSARSFANLQAEMSIGYSPIVVTEPGFPPEAEWEGDHIEEIEGIEHIRLMPGCEDLTQSLPLDQFGQLYADLALQEVLSIKPQIIHVSSGRRGYETAKVGLAIGKATGIPVVYEIRSFFEGTWTSDIKREAGSETYHKRLSAERECALRADFVLTISETMREELHSWGIDPEKILVVPNGVDTEKFIPAPKNNDLAKRLEVEDKFVLGYVSNLDHPRESQETLVEATKLLQERGLNVVCLLVGGGPRLVEIRNLAKKLDIEDSVITTGPVPHEQIVDYYRLIDIFVVPRREERAARLVTPLKPFEAMAAGVPVVTSDLPALVEIVNPPHRGLTFTERDPHALARVLEHLIEHPELRESLSEEARKWVVSERQWAGNGYLYQHAYEIVKGNENEK